MDGKVAQAQQSRKAASLLLLASARGYLEDVRALLSSDEAPLPTDGAVADRRRATPAHYAAAGNHSAGGGCLAVLRHLWSVGAELEAEDSGGRTPLHYAAAGRSAEAVDFLVSTAKVWPGPPDAEDDTPLHLAVRTGDVALVKRFLSAVKASTASELLKDRNKRGLTALGEALLLSVSSSSASSNDDDEKRPRPPKVRKEDVFAMADALVAARGGGDDGRDSAKEWPLLHAVAAAGAADGVEWILERRKDPVDLRSSEASGSLTPLHAAALGGSAAVARLLVERGADVEALDGAGRTAAEAFESAFALAARGAAASDSSSSSGPTPLPLATAGDVGELRSLLSPSSVGGKKGDSSRSSASSTASVEAFSSASAADAERGDAAPSSPTFEFESPASTFRALSAGERASAARRWAQLDDDDALEAATSPYAPAAHEHAKLARSMRHARAIAAAVASLHDDEDFQEAARLKRSREAVAAVQRDPSAVSAFQNDPKVMDVLFGIRKLQAVCAANGRHSVPFEELVVAPGEGETTGAALKRTREADKERLVGLGKLFEEHAAAAAAAACEDDATEAAAAAERSLAEARGDPSSNKGDEKPAGLLARAKAALAAASAEAEAAERAEAAATSADGSATETRKSFDWQAFWKALSKAMAASLFRAAIAFVVLWVVVKATTPPPPTAAVPPTTTEAEL